MATSSGTDRQGEASTPATLVDSNVLLDLFTQDPAWLARSREAVAAAADSGPLVINPVVYAEVSHRFSRIEDLDETLSAADVRREQIPWQAAFLAAKAHAAYRRRGGSRTSTLPDFFIGAHAAVAGFRLLTRDAARYRMAFPTLDLVAPC